jgi:autotransporter-associated beta strand protein
LVVLFLALTCHAQSFSIDWHTIDSGGGTSAGGAFSLTGTIGQPDGEGRLTGGNFSLISGFWSLPADDETGTNPPVRHEWTGTVSGNWSEPLNWDPPTVPGAEDPLLFLGNATRKSVTNDLPPRAFGDIRFAGGEYHIYGNAMLLGSQPGNTITYGGALSNTFHVEILLGGPITILAAGTVAATPLVFLGNINLGSHRLQVDNDGVVTVASPISGTGGITKNRHGRLVFSGSSANTYSGSTIVTEGVLELRKSGGAAVPGDLHLGINLNSPTTATALYAAPHQVADAAAVYVLRTGTLNLTNHDDTVAHVDLSGGNITTGAGVLTLNGDIACTRQDVGGSAISGRLHLGGQSTRIDVQTNALLIISAVVSSGPVNTELQKDGPGELRLEAANTYTARTRVGEGTLQVTASGGLGGGASEVILEGGTLLLVNSVIDGKELVASAPGIIAIDGQVSRWNGAMNFTGMVDIDTALNSSLVCSGRMGGLGGFRKTSAGLLRLEGAEGNTFMGGAAIIEECSNSPNPLAGNRRRHPRALNIGEPFFAPGAAEIRYLNPHQIADDAPVILDHSARVQMQGWSDTIGSLSGEGEVRLGSATLTVGWASAPPALATTYTGVISGTGGW